MNWWPLPSSCQPRPHRGLWLGANGSLRQMCIKDKLGVGFYFYFIIRSFDIYKIKVCCIKTHFKENIVLNGKLSMLRSTYTSPPPGSLPDPSVCMHPTDVLPSW